MGGNAAVLRNGKLQLDLRKNLFLVRMVKHWNDPKGAVDPPSLAVSSTQVDGALSCSV